MNERQIKLLNRLFDGFEGKLTNSNWAAIAKSSPDTALRDITELMALGVLRRMSGGGRSTSYELAPPEDVRDKFCPVGRPLYRRACDCRSVIREYARFQAVVFVTDSGVVTALFVT